MGYLSRMRYLEKAHGSTALDMDPTWEWEVEDLETGRKCGGYAHSFDECVEKLAWFFSPNP